MTYMARGFKIPRTYTCTVEYFIIYIFAGTRRWKLTCFHKLVHDLHAFSMSPMVVNGWDIMFPCLWLCLTLQLESLHVIMFPNRNTKTMYYNFCTVDPSLRVRLQNFESRLRIMSYCRQILVKKSQDKIPLCVCSQLLPIMCNTWVILLKNIVINKK
jgi:hypothetical protein